jgi:hypothetical protein
VTAAARLTINALVRHLPRLMFLAAAFTVRDLQAHFDIPTWTLLIAALPGLVVLTAVTDRMVGWLKHALESMEGGES